MFWFDFLNVAKRQLRVLPLSLIRQHCGVGDMEGEYWVEYIALVAAVTVAAVVFVVAAADVMDFLENFVSTLPAS